MYWETLSEFLEFVREAKGNIKNLFKIITIAFCGEFPTKGQKVWDYSNWDTFVHISCVSNNSMCINSFGIELDACSISKIFC